MAHHVSTISWLNVFTSADVLSCLQERLQCTSLTTTLPPTSSCAAFEVAFSARSCSIEARKPIAKNLRQLFSSAMMRWLYMRNKHCSLQRSSRLQPWLGYCLPLSHDIGGDLRSWFSFLLFFFCFLNYNQNQCKFSSNNCMMWHLYKALYFKYRCRDAWTNWIIGVQRWTKWGEVATGQELQDAP